MTKKKKEKIARALWKAKDWKIIIQEEQKKGRNSGD